MEMSKMFVVLLMIFFHVLDDYGLQGILASMKQKSWWKETSPEKLYKYDYMMALFMHAFSWTFMIMLPIAYYYRFNVDVWFLLWFAINISTHAVVDDLKANKKEINLITDQLIHLFQIAFTGGFFLGVMT